MIELKLVALLGPLVGGRIYPDVAPQGAALPRIVYQQAGGVAPTYIDDVVPSLRNARMQIVAWAETRAQAAQLMLLIEAALVVDPTLQARPLGAMTAIHEPDTVLYGARQDFSVWADR